MQLHELNQFKKNRKGRRIGRGGKRGTTSGRGQKGQKSRSGRRLRPALRDLIIRLPKRRGFKNKVFRLRPIVLSLKDIEKLGGEVTMTVLKEKGLVPRRFRGKVKILSPQNLKDKLVIKGLEMSKSVRAEIEKAGGKVT